MKMKYNIALLAVLAIGFVGGVRASDGAELQAETDILGKQFDYFMALPAERQEDVFLSAFAGESPLEIIERILLLRPMASGLNDLLSGRVFLRNVLSTCKIPRALPPYHYSVHEWECVKAFLLHVLCQDAMALT